MSNDCFFKVTCSGDDDFTSAYQVGVKFHGTSMTKCSVLINSSCCHGVKVFSLIYVEKYLETSRKSTMELYRGKS